MGRLTDRAGVVHMIRFTLAPTRNLMRGFKFFKNATPRRASSRPARLRCGIELLREVGGWGRPPRVWSTASGSKNSLQEVIFRAARWQGQHEARMTRGSRCPVCIEIPYVMDSEKCSVIFGGFPSLQGPRNVFIHSPCSPASKNTFVT